MVMVINNTDKLSLFHSLFLLVILSFVPLSPIFLPETALSAQPRYIKPSSEVAVRRGQGVDYKIIAMVKDGTGVELLEENDAYARIRLQNGKEGWMLKRFLSASPPLVEVVATLRTEKVALEQREQELMQNLEEISSTLSQTRSELDSTLSERDRIWADFQTLQRETEDVVNTKNELMTTKKENQQLAQELSSVQRERERLEKNSAIKWFLAGGGVLLLGMVIGGTMAGKSKRKSSLQF